MNAMWISYGLLAAAAVAIIALTPGAPDSAASSSEQTVQPTAESRDGVGDRSVVTDPATDQVAGIRMPVIWQAPQLEPATPSAAGCRASDAEEAKQPVQHHLPGTANVGKPAIARSVPIRYTGPASRRGG